MGFATLANQEWKADFDFLVNLIEKCKTEIDEDYAAALSLKSSVEAEGRVQRTAIAEERKQLMSDRTDWESRLTTLRNEVTAIEETISIKKKENIEVLSTLEKNRQDLVGENSHLKEVLKNKEEISTKLSEIEKVINEKSEMGKSLDRSIADKRIKLDELNRDESLFAVDLKGYGQQGVRQIRKFYILTGLCIALGIVLTYFSLGEVDLIWKDILAYPTKIDWPLIAITRLSLFMVYTTAIGALSTIAFAFIRRILGHSDRVMRLSEISILARDATDAALSDTSASEQQRIAVFFSVRMALIRNLLSGTFESLRNAKREDKESQLNAMKVSDLAYFSKLLQNISMANAETKK